MEGKIRKEASKKTDESTYDKARSVDNILLSYQLSLTKDNLAPCKAERRHSYSNSQVIKNQMKVVIGSLEGILSELKTVVVDLHDVVVQIDDVTNQLTGSKTDCQKLSRTKAFPELSSSMKSSYNFSGDSEIINSLDSGLADISGNLNSTRRQSRNDFHSNNCCLRKDLCDKECDFSKDDYKENLNYYDTMLRRQSVDVMENICDLSLKQSRKSALYSYVCSKFKNGRINKNNKHKSVENEADNSTISHQTPSNLCDYYERQLEEKLENASIDNHCTYTLTTVMGKDFKTMQKPSVANTHSLTPSFIEKMRTDCVNYDSDDVVSDGGDVSEDNHTSNKTGKEAVIKSSDSFRYKIKQIGLGKKQARNWRVTIKP